MLKPLSSFYGLLMTSLRGFSNDKQALHNEINENIAVQYVVLIYCLIEYHVIMLICQSPYCTLDFFNQLCLLCNLLSIEVSFTKLNECEFMYLPFY